MKTYFNSIVSLINSSIKETNAQASGKSKLESIPEIIMKHLRSLPSNVTPEKITNDRDETLAQYYLTTSSLDEFEIILTTYKILLKQTSPEKYYDFLLNKNLNEQNIFEQAAELSDIRIFKILSRIIYKDKTLTSKLLPKNEENVFHISAKLDKPLSILFYYKMFKEYDKNCLNSLYNNSTPLYLACYSSGTKAAKMLIDLNCNLNARCLENRTALHMAVMQRNIDVIKKMIIYGVDKNLKDNKGQTPFDYAKGMSNNRQLVEFLKTANCGEVVFKCETDYESPKKGRKDFILITIIVIVLLGQLFSNINQQAYKHKKKEIYKESIKSFSLFKDWDINFVIKYFCIFFEFITLIISLKFKIEKHKLYKVNKTTSEFIELENGTINNENLLFDINRDKSTISIDIDEVNDYNDFSQKELEEIMNDVNEYNNNERYCLVCKKVRKERTVHCVACNICFENYDHHCFWLDICIYGKNLRSFNAFFSIIVFLIFLNFFNGLFSIIPLLRHNKDLDNYGKFTYYCFGESNKYARNFGIFSCVIIMLYTCILFYFVLSSVFPFFKERANMRKQKKVINK